MRNPRTSLRNPGVTVTAAAGLFAAAFLVAGCSGGAGSSGTSSSAARAAPAQHAAGGAAGAPNGQKAAGSVAQPGGSGQPGGRGATGTTATLAPAGRQLIYTADLTVRAHDVAKAVTSATRIVAGAGGYVSDESTTAAPAHSSRSSASLQLKIPVAVYPATLSTLSGSLGTQVSLTQQARDVTGQVADTNSRVASDEAAIAQLRALLSHAGSVGDLLQVQNQISTEESDLEAMQAQQHALDHETAYATVSLSLLGPLAVVPKRRPAHPPSLAAGLTDGWHALRVTVSWLLAVLGAIAPFGLAAALIAFLAYRVTRWFTRRRTPPLAR